jgi:hypothetical protein
MKKILGVTLIELMLALTGTAFILSLLSSIYLTAQTSFTTQSDLSQLQDNARIAASFLTHDIHLAGYIGCAKLTADFPLKNTTDFILNADNKISVNKDSITVRHADTAHDNLLAPMSDYSILQTAQDVKFFVDDILLIADCKSADIFKVKEIYRISGGQEIMAEKPLSNFYQMDAEVSKLEFNTYTAGNTGRLNNKNEPVYALYLNNTELVEGVKELRAVLDQDKAKITGISLLLTLMPASRQWRHYIALRE